MIDKVNRLETDAVILDLEDAVPILDKETARIFVRDVIELDEKKVENPFPHLKLNRNPHICVRINSFSSGLYKEDLNYIVVDGLDSVMVPKSETEKDIRRIDELLEKSEQEKGLEKGRITLIPLIETAKGVINANGIASASERVISLGFGAVDFTADTRIRPSKENIELLYPRAHLSIIAHAYGLQPIDTPWVNIQDVEGLLEDCKMARKLGYTGKMAIHPIQLKYINEAFSPSKDEIEYAKKVLEAFKDTATSGLGAISLDGKMIDHANLRQAEETLRLAELIEKRK